MPHEPGDQAVVLGGSMAGLLAARVLADFYRQVTVIDRDAMPEAGAHRRGVPQGRPGVRLLESTDVAGLTTIAGRRAAASPDVALSAAYIGEVSRWR